MPEIKEKLLSLGHAQAQQERIVNELIQAMIDMDMDTFEAVLSDYITVRGIDRTINQIVFPFLERIGILWLTYHINPAQEHLVTNIIRQKLIVGIENISSLLLTRYAVSPAVSNRYFIENGTILISVEPPNFAAVRSATPDLITAPHQKPG